MDTPLKDSPSKFTAWAQREKSASVLPSAAPEGDTPPKRNPFHRFKSVSEICSQCKKPVYHAEKQTVKKMVFHFLCAGIYIEQEKRAPVHNIAEEKNTNKGDNHYQTRETSYSASNLANFGTKLEVDAKKLSAQGEPAWIGAGQKDGIEIFRIEKFKVVRIPLNQYGQFFTGDSYIVLKTNYKGINQKKEPQFGWDIHFWLGSKTTQDEAGTAAYKTVELDNHLGGGPTQHREIEGYESHLFLSYFADKGGLRLLEGGVDSGFRTVEAETYKPRLLWIKGRKNVRVVQVPINVESLNSGDVFVLDMGLDLYQWQGSESAPPERLRAALLCRAIDEERAGKPKVHVVDESDHHHLNHETREFWRILGHDTKQHVKSGDGVAGDEAWEKEGILKLFRLSDASGEMKFTLVAEGKNVTLDKLDPMDVFVLDCGFEIIVWIGRGASEQERKTGMQHAKEYLDGAGRPNYLPVSKVLDGGENEVWNSFFTH